MRSSNHTGGDFSVKALDHRVDQLLFHRVVSRMLFLMLQLLPQVLFQFIQSIELADILGKLVIEHGQLLALNLMKLALENDRLACQLLGVILLGEGDVDVEFILSVVADNLLLKAGNKLTCAQLERIALALTTVEGSPIQKALEVNDRGIAHLRGAALYRDDAGIALLQTANLSIDLLVADGRPRDAQP